MPEAPILFTWAHLSDLHFGAGGAGTGFDRRLVLRVLREDLAGATGRGCPRLDAIFVTGDVAWSGAEAEYREAAAWLGETAEKVGVGRDQVYVVPGNHDVDRAAGGDRNAVRLVQSLRAGLTSLDEALREDRDLLGKPQRHYLAFASQLAPACASLFWTQPIAARGDLRLRLVGLNTALLAVDGADHGKPSLDIDGERRRHPGLPRALVVGELKAKDEPVRPRLPAPSYV
jgi:hypothetical protein